MSNKKGTFYGIGVGPGDPDLVTVKAIHVLQRVDIVYAASSTKNSHSLAVSIAKPYIPEKTPIHRLSFPMTTDRSVTQTTWQEHALTIHQSLDKGLDTAFLTLGDPMTYSTYGYVLRHLKRIDPQIDVTTVPGITSYQAAAARINTPLVEGEESLLIVSGALGGDRLRRLAAKPETVVFLKAYRNISDIACALVESTDTYQCTGISKCGRPDEKIVNDIGEFKDRSPDYWTLIIAKKNR